MDYKGLGLRKHGMPMTPKLAINSSLRQWCDNIVHLGPSYGYFANPFKTVLVVKPHRLEEAKLIFDGTGVTLSEGARDLGGAIGSESFLQNYVTDKVSKLCKIMSTLSTIAINSPQAAHSAFVHGIKHIQRVHDS
jgi:hypothetical protein